MRKKSTPNNLYFGCKKWKKIDVLKFWTVQNFTHYLSEFIIFALQKYKVFGVAFLHVDKHIIMYI
jgi:hypothetical protein